MRPLKIRILGKYWDSYLYDDQLMLVTRDGVMESYRWDRLMEGVSLSYPDLWQPFKHLTCRGKAWYGLAVQELIGTDRVRPAFEDAVTLLSELSYTITRSALSQTLRYKTEVTLFPSTDMEIWANTIFIGSTDGLVEAKLRDRKNMDLSRRSLVLDAPTVKMSASYGHLAAAHGEDGLSEFDISSDWLVEYASKSLPYERRMARTVSSRRCDSCDWVSFDIIGSSAGSGGYLGAFSKPPRIRDGDRSDFELFGTIDSDQLFGQDGGLLVGAGNVLMLAKEGELWTERWNPYRRRDEHGLDLERSRVTAPEVSLRTPDAEPLDAAVAVFGVVLELDDHLVVHQSDGHRFRISGEPVNWRVFPRSTRYLNQLHVVKENYLDIYAFTHDYFVPSADRTLSMNRPQASAW